MTEHMYPSDLELDDLRERDPAFSLFWDSGSPGAGADFENIYRWQDRYVVQGSLEGDEVTYPSLLEAATLSGLCDLTPAVKAISSTEWSAQEIANCLQLGDLDEHILRLNNDPWTITASGARQLG